jgi:hypothetical protein
MAAQKSLVWKGDALTARMKAAQREGVNRTMAACVVHARDNHPWKNQTAALEGSIDVQEYAVPVATGVEGKWGSADINYALPLELGATIEHPGGTAYYIDEKTGLAVFVKNSSPLSEGLPRTKPHTIVLPPHPFLRPAADVKYPELAANIGKAWKKYEAGPAPGSVGGDADG